MTTGFVLGQDQYIIWIKGVPNGYILTENLPDMNYEGVNTHIRKTRTALKTQLGSKAFDSQILEQVLYQDNPMVYILEQAHQGQMLGQQKYSIEKGSLRMVALQNGKEQLNLTFPIPNDTLFIGDYFSFLPLLEKARAHPVTLSVVDFKKINPESTQLPVQQVLIKPGGQVLFKLPDISYTGDSFQVYWDQTVLRMIIEKQTKRLLQIQDEKSGMRISLATASQIQDLAQIPQQSFFKKLRPIPYQSGLPYKYKFIYDQQPIGEVVFTIVHPQADRQYYEMQAQGYFTRKGKPNYTFRSITRYAENLSPLFYQIQEEPDTTITCEFGTQGVKEFFQQRQHILEHFIPLSPDSIFLDNNPIHHFAMALGLCPLTVGTKFSLSVFHPRRLQINRASYNVLAEKDGLLVVEFNTDYYNTQLFVQPNGILESYQQEKLQVILQK